MFKYNGKEYKTSGEFYKTRCEAKCKATGPYVHQAGTQCLLLKRKGEQFCGRHLPKIQNVVV